MKIFLKTGLILAGVLGFTHNGTAADLDPTIVRADTSVEYGSGWYLRGHVGYSKGNGENQAYDADGSSADFDFVRQDEDSGYSSSVGFGYIFNRHFRMDATMDFNSERLWTGTDGAVSDSSSYDLTNYSVNGYMSLGRFAGISPFIGAGIGVADVKWNDHVFTGLAGVTSLSGISHRAMTYSLIGGFDYRIDKNWLLDFEYKHTNVAGGITLQDAVGTSVVSSTSQDFSMHDFRIGLRYEIW